MAAAEELLAEQGYRALSLKAIGHRAGVPTASVYHYFSDREQVEAELVHGHMDALSREVSAAMDASAPGSVEAAVDAFVDAVVAYYRGHPGFRELWLVGRNAASSEIMGSFDGAEIEKQWRLLVERHLIRPDTPHLVVALAFEAGDRLLEVAFRGTAMGDDAVIAEAKRLVVAYVGAHAPDAG